MVATTQSTCIYHPTKQAVNRCKQCGAGTCHPCTVAGPTGRFCSERCRDTHEAFSQRAQELNTRAPGGRFLKVRKLVGSLLVFAAVLLAAGVVSSVVYIPVLSGLTLRVRAILGW
jgi:hypothetical protein